MVFSRWESYNKLFSNWRVFASFMVLFLNSKYDLDLVGYALSWASGVFITSNVDELRMPVAVIKSADINRFSYLNFARTRVGNVFTTCGFEISVG